jgi:APA family basic amino acid/polyamine antiporter
VRTRTPFISIILFSLAAIIILIPSLFAREGFLRLGTLYAFGSLLSFIFAHASVISLRIKNPDWHRPFKLGWNIKFRDRELPVTALLGMVGTLVIWIVVIATQPYSRWVGLGWIAAGLIIYIIYRLIKKLPIIGIAKPPITIKVQDYFQAMGEKLNR